jgi:transmembrane sensor
MSQEKFWVLLSKKLSAEASAQELVELENLIIEHPEWQYAIQNLEDLWKHQPQKDNLHEEDAYMLHLHRMTELNIPFGDGPVDLPAIPRRNNRAWYWAAAACLVAVAGFLTFGRNNNTEKEAEPITKQTNEISTHRGSKSKVQLPDGTTVWLNSGSKLTYNKDFGKGVREVSLSGEGYFDVKRNPDVPFIIHTSSINIKVLGTVFNVKAYPEDEKTETSLIHGSIEVTIKNRPNDKIILSPSEKLVVDNNTISHNDKVVTSKDGGKVAGVDFRTLMAINKLKYVNEDSVIGETEWVHNRLFIRDESFKEMAVKLERWYNVRIDISDDRLMEKRFSATFENETIEQVLDALKMIVPFKYKYAENEIIIHP